jgi:hypothetical protein
MINLVCGINFTNELVTIREFCVCFILYPDDKSFKDVYFLGVSAFLSFTLSPEFNSLETVV